MPDENPTGDYRRTFAVPDEWAGLDAILRFGGVDSCLRAWLNGEIGSAQGSRLPSEFDVGALRPGAGERARRTRAPIGPPARIQKIRTCGGSRVSSATSRCWARPTASLDDFFVHTGYDHVTGQGISLYRASAPARLVVPELALDIATGGAHRPG